MPALTQRWPAILTTAALFACLLPLAASREFYESAMVSVFFAFALASAAVLLFAVRPPSDAIPVLAATAALAFLEFVVLGFPHDLPVVPLLSLLGLSCLLVLGIRTAWAEGEERRLLLCAFVPAVLFMGSEWVAATLLEWTNRLHPKALDLYLYAFDGSLGVQLSFVVGQWFARFPDFRALCLIGYIALPLPLAVTYAAHLRHRGTAALPVGLAFLITGPVGVVFYNLLPANGPHYLFSRDFPFHPLRMAEARRLLLEPVALPGFHNAIPSLHMGWVVLAWWLSAGMGRWTRLFVLVFVVLTFFATLGTGEHYFVDLVVAVPFALLVEALADYATPLRDARRSRPLVGGLLLTLLWLGLLSFVPRLWWISPAVPWTLVAATLAASVALRRIRTQTAGQERAIDARVAPVARM